MVASSQRAASEVGAAVLRAGANAADAAVAMAAALAVTEPVSTGIGGDAFALYFDAATREVSALNGSGRAPAALSLERLASEGLAELPPEHGHTVTVPGACAAWCELVARHGTRSLAELLAPAIELATEGFEVAPVTAHFWARAVPRLATVFGGEELLIEGRAPREGERFRNPGLARTLRRVAGEGAEGFYRGEIARAIVEAVGASGGALAAGDLESHRSTWDAPIRARYRGVDVWQCPPNGQGITALIALRILEMLRVEGTIDLAGQDPLGAPRLHALIEALRLAFADARGYVADPRVTEVPTSALLTDSYTRARAALVDGSRATADVRRGAPVGHSETVYFAVVDGEGNACSFINSNYTGVGTGIVPRGWGFPLQNRGLNFSLDARRPNALAPHKRPYHTIMPGMLTRPDGALDGPFGVMGGFMQPQGHVQVLVAMLDDALDPQAALDRPRFCIDPIARGASRVLVEAGVPRATTDRLAAMGHAIVPGVDGWERSHFGRGQIIRRDHDALVGGSDTRADGCVLSA